MRCPHLLLAALLAAARLQAQQPAQVEVLASIMMTEDRRVLDPAILAPALEHPDPLVRRTAIVAIGRIGNPDGVLLLIPRLNDPEPSVVTEAFFAIGLLGDPRAVAPIHDRLRLTDSIAQAALPEAATALARIGSDQALDLLRGIITGASDLPQARMEQMRGQAVLESWRHGSRAPVTAILPLVRDTSVAMRWQALYTLARLSAPEAVEGFIDAVRDRTPLLREVGARGLSRRVADSSGAVHSDFVRELVRLLDDDQPV
ncbi:MAG TPA: HEAT repeat domain-containing protein [Gemmatimonadales bacterium]|nr:HEAT repeat domain-containing protein [Gemmatimonadales bacterium]